MSAVPCHLTQKDILSGCVCSKNKKSCPQNLGSGKSTVQKVLEGGGRERRPPSIAERALDPSKLSKEERETRTRVPLIAGGKPVTSSPGDPDEDCNDYGWFKFLCVGGKSTIKGWNDCGGTGISCGYLLIGALAAVLIFQVLR